MHINEVKMENFKELGLSQETIDILEKKGYTEPTEIQRLAIPMLMNGTRNIVGKSQTGTGKTAVFALPILEKLRPGKNVNALILTPTRELAIQVKNEIDSLKGTKKISTLTVYGGTPIKDQIYKLRSGVDIVVGTPGRVIDLINRNILKLKLVDYVVLDEADEMLNMGFVEDIEEILRSTNARRQMLLFSATMPPSILNIARKFMGQFETLNVKGEKVTPGLTDQIYYDVMSTDRIECLRRVMDITPDFYGIIFCKTKVRVDFVSNKLIELGYNAAALHGDISQGQREQILGQFRTKRINVLVATDVAARGIDVIDLTHVINYSLPQSPELYVHRIGRTGRAGKKGIAITFIIPSEKRYLKMVEKVVQQNLVRAEIPSVKNILELKESNSVEVIQNIIEKSKSFQKYSDLAEGLIEKYDPKKIILALLQYGFKKDFDVHNYKELKQVKSEPSRGSSRDRGRGRSGRSNFFGESRFRNKNKRRTDGRGNGRKNFRSRSSDDSRGDSNKFRSKSHGDDPREGKRKFHSNSHEKSGKKSFERKPSGRRTFRKSDS